MLRDMRFHHLLASGLDAIRLRPRKELIEMGLFQPRAPKPQDAAGPRDESAESR